MAFFGLCFVIPSCYLLLVRKHKHCIKGCILTRCLNGRFVILLNRLIYKSHFRFDMKSPQSSKMEVTEGMNWSLSPISIEPFVYKVKFVMYHHLTF